MQTVTQRAVPINAAKLARQGDARALLAIPDARDDIPRLIAGQSLAAHLVRNRKYSWFLTATDLGNRKAIAEAKRIVAERESRREARKAAEAARTPRPGRVLADAAVRRAKQAEAERQAVEGRLDSLLDR